MERYPRVRLHPAVKVAFVIAAVVVALDQLSKALAVDLLDRVLRAPGPLRGGVVDWLQPAGTAGWMNLADLAISAGVAVVAIAALLDAWRSRARPTVPDES